MVHEQIREKENEILQMFPELYIGTLEKAIEEGVKNGKKRK